MVPNLPYILLTIQFCSQACKIKKFINRPEMLSKRLWQLQIKTVINKKISRPI